MSSRDGVSASLAGKSMLISGPAGPLAPRIACAAQAHGARVVLTGSGEPPTDVMDRADGSLRSEAEADRLVEAAVSRLSRLEVLIAVVAAPAFCGLHELSLAGWSHHVSEPLRSMFWLAQRVVEEFIGGQIPGRLVFVVERPPNSTSAGRNEIVEAAVLSFCRSVAKEYGRRSLACNAVVGALDPAAVDPSAGNQHEPLVATTLFLASSSASFVNGESVELRPAMRRPARFEGGRS